MTHEELMLDYDNQTKLEKYYNGRKIRRYLQLLEIAEQVVRSLDTSEEAKKVARQFANHYRRMVISITLKPFNPTLAVDSTAQDHIFVNEIARLSSLFDIDFKTPKIN
jgi:hypothetical protein